MGKPGIFTIALLLFALGCSTSDRGAGTIAPDFRLNDLTGKTCYLNAELKEKPVVLTFFATWCTPCKEEVPLLIDLHKSLGNKITLLCVVVDPENIDKVRNFSTALSIPYPMLLDEGRKVMDRYGLSELPATFLIDTKGKIRSRFGPFGETESRSLRDDILRITGSK